MVKSLDVLVTVRQLLIKELCGYLFEARVE